MLVDFRGKERFRPFYRLLVRFGIDPLKPIRLGKSLLDCYHDYITLKHQEAFAKQQFKFAKWRLFLADKFTESGVASGHYFHQDLLVARRVYQNAPTIHLDIGSRIDGFVAHVASFREIVVMDIRPLSYHLPNVKFVQVNLTLNLEPQWIDYCDSLSCLHTLEHFGLGRYGDSVDYDGYLVGLNNLYRILRQGGKLYLSVPIGSQRIEFNAHRVFSMRYLLDLFDGKFQIDFFSYVDDAGALHEHSALTKDAVANNLGCNYGCGIFEMTKI